MKLNDSTYFIIQSWMVNKLKLKTTERDVFAIIYGFSQDGQSEFYGSLSYISELTGYSKNSICTALKNLTEKNLILKDEKIINNIKYCSYRINVNSIQATCMGIQATCTPIQATCINNINNNIDKKEFISKDINSKERGKNSDFNFGKKTEAKPSLYSRCVSMIDAFIVDNKCVDIREDLIEYLKFRLEVKDKPLYINMWKGMLNKLEELHAKGYNYSEIIQFNLLKGYLSFYEPSKAKSKERASEPKHGTGCKKNTAEEDKQREVFLKQMKKEGKRVAF